MNIKRYLFSVLAVFLVFELLNYLIHSVLLSECYAELVTVWRKNMADFLWAMYLTDLFFTLFFVSIYSRWSKRYSVGSGMIYGLIVGLMMNTSGAISQWIIYPITNHLMVLWVVLGLSQFMICGFVVGLIYKPRKKQNNVE